MTKKQKLMLVSLALDGYHAHACQSSFDRCWMKINNLSLTTTLGECYGKLSFYTSTYKESKMFVVFCDKHLKETSDSIPSYWLPYDG